MPVVMFSKFCLSIYVLIVILFVKQNIIGDSRNYLPLILVPSSTQTLVIAKLNGRKYFSLRDFVCNIIRPSKELPVQS